MIWGYVGLNTEWGPLYNTYGEFLRVTLGYGRFGVGTCAGEALSDGKEIDASLLPLSFDYLIWKNDIVNGKRVYFKDFLVLRLNFTPWGTRWQGKWVFGDYYNSGKFIADIDYVSLNLIFLKRLLWVFYIKSNIGVHLSMDKVIPSIQIGAGINTAGYLLESNLKNSLKILSVVQNSPVDQEDNIVLEMIVMNRGNRDIERIKITCLFDDKFKNFFEAETVMVDGIKRGEIKRIDINIFRRGGYFPPQKVPVKLILNGGKDDIVVKKIFLRST